MLYVMLHNTSTMCATTRLPSLTSVVLFGGGGQEEVLGVK